MPVIMKDNVQYAYTTKGTVFHTLSNAEYEALTEEEKMNGDVYCIPDREPVINPDQLWEKVGTDTLDTTAQDLSGAVNELNSSIGTMNIASVQRITLTTSTGATGNIALGYTNDGYTYIIGAFVNGTDAYIRPWVASSNGKWYLTAVNPNTGATINNTTLDLRFLLVKIKSF